MGNLEIDQRGSALGVTRQILCYGNACTHTGFTPNISLRHSRHLLRRHQLLMIKISISTPSSVALPICFLWVYYAVMSKFGISNSIFDTTMSKTVYDPAIPSSDCADNRKLYFKNHKPQLPSSTASKFNELPISLTQHYIQCWFRSRHHSLATCVFKSGCQPCTQRPLISYSRRDVY